MTSIFRFFRHKIQGAFLLIALMSTILIFAISTVLVKITTTAKVTSKNTIVSLNQKNITENAIKLVINNLHQVTTATTGFSWVNNPNTTVGTSRYANTAIAIHPESGSRGIGRAQWPSVSAFFTNDELDIRKMAVFNDNSVIVMQNFSSLPSLSILPTQVGGYFVQLLSVKKNPSNAAQAIYQLKIHAYICDQKAADGRCISNSNITDVTRVITEVRSCPIKNSIQLEVASDPGKNFYSLNCACPNNQTIDANGNCTSVVPISCPGGSVSSGGAGAIPPGSTSCQCPSSAMYWDGNNCVSSCPAGSPYSIFYACYSCPNGIGYSPSVTQKQGDIVPNTNNLCFCPSNTPNWTISRCMAPCPIDSVWGNTNIGEAAGNSGCYCMTTEYYWNGSSCVLCPQWAQLSGPILNAQYTRTDNPGDSLGGAMASCKCPSNYPKWYPTHNMCGISCPTGSTFNGMIWMGGPISDICQCPGGGTLDASLSTSGATIPNTDGCKCPNSNPYWDGTNCVTACPADKPYEFFRLCYSCSIGVGVTSGLVGYPIPNNPFCACPKSAPIWSTTTNSCWSCGGVNYFCARRDASGTIIGHNCCFCSSSNPGTQCNCPNGSSVDASTCYPP